MGIQQQALQLQLLQQSNYKIQQFKSQLGSEFFTIKEVKKKKWTWEGGGGTEKPNSEAMERASDIPPSRLIGFLPTHVESLPIIGFCLLSLSLSTTSTTI